MPPALKRLRKYKKVEDFEEPIKKPPNVSLKRESDFLKKLSAEAKEPPKSKVTVRKKEPVIDNSKHIKKLETLHADSVALASVINDAVRILEQETIDDIISLNIMQKKIQGIVSTLHTWKKDLQKGA